MATRPCFSSEARNHMMASSDTEFEMPSGSQISPPVSSPVPSLRVRARRSQVTWASQEGSSAAARRLGLRSGSHRRSMGPMRAEAHSESTNAICGVATRAAMRAGTTGALKAEAIPANVVCIDSMMTWEGAGRVSVSTSAAAGLVSSRFRGVA